MMETNQLDLFTHIANVYAESGSVISNERLYSEVAARAGIDKHDLDQRVPIGTAGEAHSPLKRKIRWAQQTLKAMGVIERVADARGVWQLTEAAGRKLHQAGLGVKMLAFSTDLGICIWGSNVMFSNLGEPVTLCVTSPPFPLAVPRAYGNPKEAEYIDFICKSLEGIVKHLVPGGSICLNVSNDIFMTGCAARSLYRERLVLALCERFDLAKMDEIIWHNPSKPPGPIRYASLQRNQLNAGYEVVYWFTNDPMKVKADNRRVLQPHNKRHLELMARGGESNPRSSGDGAYRVRVGSYANQTEGRIPRNILTIGHRCADSIQYSKDARALGLPVHGAMMPLALPEFLIKFLSEIGDLIVDPFSGTGKTAMAAEKLGRRWVAAELMLEYCRGKAERFRAKDGFYINPGLEAIKGVA